jgi:L-fuconolactonase
MEAIKRSFLPEDWTPLAPEKNTNITPHSFPDSRINTPDSRLPSPDSRLKTPNSGLIAIQAAQTWQETEFLLSLAEKHSFIKGVVGWINLTNSKIEIQNSKSLKGFRHIVQSEPQGFMLQKSFLNGIEFIGKQGFTYDILIKYTQLDEAFEMVKQFPNQKFVIDHLAKPDIRNAEIEHWKNGIEKFKTLDNVYCKISGMVTEADWKNWKYLELKPYLDVVFDVFGTKRLMYGSDWPVCLLAADYSRVYDTTASFIASLSENEQEQIFSTNGIHFYNIKT